ncbi:universal stress protein [Tenacibaculum dicentrarchi]|uniref:universal stress protein n=1 Tax=Tenacibaculum dicentrarchi TaxID=669041 RepID=UPI000C7D37E2|nr:Universal stress protein UspA [Tenacibaculum dicentrarchi]
MKKIIVPVDFSVYSENALKTAASLAKKNNAEIVVVHMLELSHVMMNQSANFTQLESVFLLELAKKKFTEFLDKDYLSEIKVTPIIKHFKIFTELDALAKRENVDLIVIGSKGTSGIEEMFIGSNTEKVIRYATTPVLVVKETPITSELQKAVFACEFSINDVGSYLTAKNFFKKLDCELELLYVSTPTISFKSSKEIEQSMFDFFEKAGEDVSCVKNVKIISDYTVESGVLYFADKSNVDIIALATHGRKGLSHFFEGSISEDIANHSKLPIISFKI